jgi:hypothetical protein
MWSEKVAEQEYSQKIDPDKLDERQAFIFNAMLVSLYSKLDLHDDVGLMTCQMAAERVFLRRLFASGQAAMFFYPSYIANLHRVYMMKKCDHIGTRTTKNEVVWFTL